MNLTALSSLKRELSSFASSRYFKIETSVASFFDQTRILHLLKNNFLQKIAREFLDEISALEIKNLTDLAGENEDNDDDDHLIFPNEFKLSPEIFKEKFWKMIRDKQLMIRSAGSALDWKLENKNPPPQKLTYSHNALQGRDQELKKGGSLNALQGHNRDTEKGGEDKYQ